MMPHVVETPVSSAIFLAIIFLAGCGPSKESGRVTVAQTEALESFESLLPIETDSVIALYRQNDPARFYATYKRQLEDISRYVDSLNRMLDTHSRIDTLAIDHTFENFGTAACAGRTIYVSSSYFLLYNDATVVRSVVTHEFGHIVYQRLSDPVRIRFEELWVQLSNAALLYLFRDGEYSGNAKFGGHPYDSPAEFFASAFNLFSNREKELQSRLQYVDPDHFPLIERLKRTVVEATSVR